jgi:pilus assembly protein CpaB
MRRFALLVISAVLLAAAAGMATYWFASRAEERALVDYEFVQVYSALAEIPANTSLSAAVEAGLAGPTDVAQKFVPEDALLAVTPENAALVTLVPLAEGQLLMTGDFVLPPEAPVLLDVPPGMVGVSVALTDPQHVGSFLQPGSRIAVLQTTQTSDALGATTTQTSVLFPEVGVLAVGGVGDTAAVSLNVSVGEGSPSTLVTLALQPAQATRLVQAVATSTLYMALLSDGTTVPYGIPATTTTGR